MTELPDAERDRFDALLEGVIASLPEAVSSRLAAVPLIVEDYPDPRLLREMGLPDDEPLCGLHSGHMLTEQSVEDAYRFPEEIYLYRAGIIEIAGGWVSGEAEVVREIRITLLHELGHHFGLDEDDLEALGYD